MKEADTDLSRVVDAEALNLIAVLAVAHAILKIN
jgi:hypothetical protein